MKELYKYKIDPDFVKNKLVELEDCSTGYDLRIDGEKMTQKRGRAAKKVMSLTQIILLTFFCDSIFPSEFLIKLW